MAVTEVGPGHVTLSDGSTIRTRCVIWGGGIMAPPLAGAAGLPQGRGGRIDVQPDLTVDGFPGVYVVGDVANIPGPDGNALPQLGSVALQSGVAAADNILADLAGKPRKPFHYHDKGIMAMIGRGAAIAEVGAHRHELHGVDRVLRLARRARRADDRRAQPHRRVHRLGLGLLREVARAAGPRPHRRRADRLGRRRGAGARDRRAVTPFAVTTVDLARIQFATTSIYHFLFVPLTLGLGAAGGDHADALVPHAATTRGCG